MIVETLLCLYFLNVLNAKGWVDIVRQLTVRFAQGA